MRLKPYNPHFLKLSLFVSIFLFGLSNNLVLNSGNTLNIQASTFQSNGSMSFASDQGDITLQGAQVQNTAGNIDFSVNKEAGNQGVQDNGGTLGDYQNKTKLREASLQFAQNPQNAQAATILQNPDGYSPDQRAQALQTFNDYASAQFGVKAPAATAVYNGNALQGTQADLAINAETGKPEQKSQLDGAYDTRNKNILINDATQDGSTQTLVQTDGHELKHSIDDQLNKKTTEAGAERFGNQATNALTDEIGQGAGVNASHSDFVELNQQAGRYELGNQIAAEAQEVDPKLTIKYGNKTLATNNKLYPGKDVVWDIRNSLETTQQALDIANAALTSATLITALDPIPGDEVIPLIGDGAVGAVNGVVRGTKVVGDALTGQLGKSSVGGNKQISKSPSGVDFYVDSAGTTVHSTQINAIQSGAQTNAKSAPNFQNYQEEWTTNQSVFSTTTQPEQEFVRVYNKSASDGDPSGTWIMEKSKVLNPDGTLKLTPQQIQQNWATTTLPDMIVDVKPKTATPIDVGGAAKNSFGPGGETQIKIKIKTEPDWYTNQRPLK